MMFSGYNKAFQPQRTAFDWLTSVDEVVDAYIADPLCGFDSTVGLTRDLLTGIQMNENRENLARMDKNLPVLFVSGAKDPVGGSSKGVLQTIDAFKRSGMKNVTIKIYPDGRHEMLNERNRGEVYGDILTWLQQREKA
jgi:alpha-beta hydrolase superfamily lysophospholipase